MNNIQTYMTNKVAPGAGYTYGTFLNDPGDGSGSEIVVKTHNDFLYCFYTPIVKYLGAVSDTDETETASDFTDAIETAIGIQNENVSLWLNGTTYGLFDHAMYLGIMYVSMITANTGNNPMDIVAKWMPCYNRDDAIVKYRNGDILPSGIEAVHNHRDALYLQYFEWGQYNYGGNSGRNFQAYGVHLDGTQITGDATLVAIFDVGGGATEYPHLDIIAPDIVGTRTLLDTRGCVAANVDSSGVADRGVVGARQEDQFQAWQLGGDAAGDTYYGYYVGDQINSIGGSANDGGMRSSTAKQGDAAMMHALSDGTNGTPRKGDETRMKNYSVGVATVLVFVEIP